MYKVIFGYLVWNFFKIRNRFFSSVWYNFSKSNPGQVKPDRYNGKMANNNNRNGLGYLFFCRITIPSFVNSPLEPFEFVTFFIQFSSSSHPIFLSKTDAEEFVKLVQQFLLDTANINFNIPSWRKRSMI